jgi:hypothetical protein
MGRHVAAAFDGISNRIMAVLNMQRLYLRKVI